MVSREQKTSKSQPCPVCGHASWCYFLADRTAVWCGRVETWNGTRGTVKPGKPGWIHRLVDRPPEKRDVAVPQTATLPPKRLAALSRIFQKQAIDLRPLADKLGLSVGVLRRLGCGWATREQLAYLETTCQYRGAWTFPMKDGAGATTGIRLRGMDGFKYAIRGGSGEGLFIPAVLSVTGRVLMAAEGPTSTAALLLMGLQAVGRPNCRAGVANLSAFVLRAKPAAVVIVGDNDKPDAAGRRAGQDAAPIVAAAVQKATGVPAGWMLPPERFKDSRDWLAGGATREDVEYRARLAIRGRVGAA